MAMIQYLLVPVPAIPRSVFLLDWGTTIVVLGGARCAAPRTCARRGGGCSLRPIKCGY